MLFLWLGIAVLTSIIAFSKGRWGFMWLILGLIFGPFALVAACAMPARGA